MLTCSSQARASTGGCPQSQSGDLFYPDIYLGPVLILPGLHQLCFCGDTAAGSIGLGLGPFLYKDSARVDRGVLVPDLAEDWTFIREVHGRLDHISTRGVY